MISSGLDRRYIPDEGDGCYRGINSNIGYINWAPNAQPMRRYGYNRGHSPVA